MAATYQQHPNRTIQQFITAGEAELASLEEPERTIRAQSLAAEFLRRFPTGDTPSPDTKEPSDAEDNDAPVVTDDVQYAEDDIAADVDADEDAPPLKIKDVGLVLPKHGEDAFLAKIEDDLYEKEIVDGNYTHGDEGSGEPRFRSCLKVKCMDNQTPNRVVIHRGPDLQVIGPIAAKPDDVQLVSEGEIRNEERGYLDYKPTRPYHDRVASWMFKLQYDRASKRSLTCQFCGEDFEGKKGQKYCSKMCSNHRTPRPDEDPHIPGECNCVTCNKVYDIFSTTRYEYMLEKYDLQPGMELQPGMRLTEAENEHILEFAKHLVKEITDEQQ
jgi:hypothetical protein